MEAMNVRGVYNVEVEQQQQIDDLALSAVSEIPAPFVDYLKERRRAIITELRKIESMLEVRQSIPKRTRPH